MNHALIIHTRAHKHTNTPRHTHTHTPRHTYARKHARKHACTHASTHARAHARTHTHTHTHADWHIHTNTHTHTVSCRTRNADPRVCNVGFNHWPIQDRWMASYDDVIVWGSLQWMKEIGLGHRALRPGHVFFL